MPVAVVADPVPDATVQIPDEEAGAEYLSEPVGDERTEDAGALNNQLFLPLINR